MNIFNYNNEDSIYWLKVAMRQAQSDIKRLDKKVLELEKENNLLKTKKSKYAPMDLNTITVNIKGN